MSIDTWASSSSSQKGSRVQACSNKRKAGEREVDKEKE